MFKLDAPDNSSIPVMSNRRYPESEATYRGSGPGWSWMRVYVPFSSDWAQGQFNHHVFKRYRTSLDDLRVHIGEEMAADADNAEERRWYKAAVAALRDATAQDFILVCSSVDWVFASFEVRLGTTAAQSGTAFYNEWVGSINATEEEHWPLVASKKPIILPR